MTTTEETNMTTTEDTVATTTGTDTSMATATGQGLATTGHDEMAASLPAITRVPACDVVAGEVDCVLDGSLKVATHALTGWCAGGGKGVAHTKHDAATNERVARLEHRSAQLGTVANTARTIAALGAIVGVLSVLVSMLLGTGTASDVAAAVVVVGMIMFLPFAPIAGTTHDKSRDLARDAATAREGTSLGTGADRVQVPDAGPAQTIARHAVAMARHERLGDPGWVEEVRDAARAQASAEQILGDEDATDEQVRTAQAVMGHLEDRARAWRDRHERATAEREQVRRARIEAVKPLEDRAREAARQRTTEELQLVLERERALGRTA